MSTRISCISILFALLVIAFSGFLKTVIALAILFLLTRPNLSKAVSLDVIPEDSPIG